MATQNKDLNIYQKLAQVRKCVEVVKKDARGYGYTYAKEEDILAKITGRMGALGLSLLPGIVPETTTVTPYTYQKTKSTKTGDIYQEAVNEVLVQADMTWTWVNNDNPDERIVVPWAMIGQQSDASQSFGSGLTYASRYFLLKYFNVATSDDDPDEWRSKQRKAEDEENALILNSILENITKEIASYLAENQDKKTDVKDFVSKYAKNGEYKKIKDVVVAGNLLSDFKNTFLTKQEE